MYKYKYKLFAILLCLNTFVLAQTKTNLEIVDSLVSVSVNDLIDSLQLENKQFIFQFNSPDDYKVFSNSVIKQLQDKGIVLLESTDSLKNILNYSIKNIHIEYGEVFRDGMFGEYLVERNVNINGSYFIQNLNYFNNIKNFGYSNKDIVVLSEINNLQNIAYSFTSPELPEEPFFSSMLEPTLAVGTAAIAVYLFFNIRSK